MTSNTGLAGIFLAVYQHGSLPLWSACGSVTVCEDVEKDEDGRRAAAAAEAGKKAGKAEAKRRRGGCECSIV